MKLPKAITHEARLVRSGPAIRRFAEEIGGLGTKLGGVLVQLPPSLMFDARVAGRFFAHLHRMSMCRSRANRGMRVGWGKAPKHFGSDTTLRASRPIRRSRKVPA